MFLVSCSGCLNVDRFEALRDRILFAGLLIAVVTLQTFYLGKHDLLTVYLGKLDFLSVTDFSPGNLPRENFIVWVLDMSRKQ